MCRDNKRINKKNNNKKTNNKRLVNAQSQARSKRLSKH